ncbi:MAG: fibronectin type III domain-containing protein [Clostridiales Family XIII bacterium]|nr:fibronectin type III domain-containing protein [Clostridiales Family XIII bacterium]
MFNISNVFNYGLIENPYPDKSPENVRRYWNIIGFGNNADLLDYYIADIFSNVYYRPEIGGRLFGLSPGNGDDGYGTERVKSVVHSKTTAEFKTAELAALLNNGRVAADAPWEYVAGADYPTLKFERADYDPALDLPPPPTYDHITAAAGYGGTIARNDEGLYTVTPAAGYVIDKIWVDGKQLEGVSGLSTYTTAATPERSIFATFIAATTNSSPALIILDRTIPAAATATATDKAAPTAPKKLAAPTAKAGKKQLKITWKKSSAKGVSGYQVQYRVVGAGQEWEMEKLGAKAMSLTIKKLKPGKIYELRVRAAKKSGGKTAYGSWSKTIKSGKVKQ